MHPTSMHNKNSDFILSLMQPTSMHNENNDVDDYDENDNLVKENNMQVALKDD